MLLIEKGVEKFGELKKYSVTCYRCNQTIETKEREKLFPKKEKYFCSKSCASKRSGGKYLLKQTVDKRYNNSCICYNTCTECNILFVTRNSKTRKTCSKKCFEELRRKNSIKSASKITRRSKNEVHLANLCKEYFGEQKVLTNEVIFNGWDADIIIPHLKLAIHWNGIWHYETLVKGHSLSQVQNRDRIKLKEIEKCNYISYTIKDLGSENKNFVEKEFIKLKTYLGIAQLVEHISDTDEVVSSSLITETF